MLENAQIILVYVDDIVIAAELEANLRATTQDQIEKKQRYNLNNEIKTKFII